METPETLKTPKEEKLGYAAATSDAGNDANSFGINGAGGGNRTHGLGIMRPSLYH
jgi:hypothetical protein